MKLPLSIAKRLHELLQGEQIASSKARHQIIDNLVKEQIIDRQGRIQKKLSLTHPKALHIYLQNKFGINDLEKYIHTLDREDSLKRSDLVAVASQSKLKPIRTFKGFMVNCYEPVNTIYNQKTMVLDLQDGIFQFIYDYEEFYPEDGVTIVGVENPENFRYIQSQQAYFEHLRPLFVSRYPQNQSKDLMRWLQRIPNPYLHFGDFDLAGIGIYINEYKKHLGDRAQFFVPDNIEKLFKKYGNSHLYDTQNLNVDKNQIREDKLRTLINLIHSTRKGLEQEVLIGEVRS
jgi:hypothetical protein